jgi:hypothetical protein
MVFFGLALVWPIRDGFLISSQVKLTNLLIMNNYKKEKKCLRSKNVHGFEKIDMFKKVFTYYPKKEKKNK